MRFLTSFVIITVVRSQNGSEYLENAINSLRKSTPTPGGQRKIDEEPKDEPLPTLTLAKNELADFYENAIKKGNTLKIGTPTGSDLNAAVYELNEDGRPNQENFHPNLQDPSGYYYYYYPLKAFMNELSSGNPKDKEKIFKQKGHENDLKQFSLLNLITLYSDLDYNVPIGRPKEVESHNIHIIEKSAEEEKSKKKALQPLFMAISGFIGMSVMFVLSMLILPKLGQVKSPKGKDSDDGNTLAKVIYDAIDGYDCSERLSCEFGKTTRAFNVHNNRFFKLLRRIGPRMLSKQLYNINKYSNKNHKCAQIQCKPPKSKKPPSKDKS